MFAGGLLGLVIGIYVLYLIWNSISKISEELAYLRSEVVRLTELLRTVDMMYISTLSKKDKGDSKSVNNLQAYASILDRSVKYDPDDDLDY